MSLFVWSGGFEWHLCKQDVSKTCVFVYIKLMADLSS